MKVVEAQILPTQKEFIESNSKKTLFLGGIGCVDGSTLIDTNKGEIRIDNLPSVFDAGEDILYKSFNGIGFSYVKGSKPFLKGVGELYKVETQEGTVIAHGSHQFLCSDGIYRTTSQLDDDLHGHNLLALFSINQDKFPYNLLEDVYIVLDKVIKYIRYYAVYPDTWKKFYNFTIAGNFQPTLEQVTEFLQGIVNAVQKDINLFSIRITSCTAISHPIKEKELEHFYYEFGSELAHIAFNLLPDLLKGVNNRKLIVKKIKKIYAIMDAHDFRYHPTDLSCNKILNITKHTERPYWDIQIPIFNNYCAHGMVHHNSGKTTAGGDFIARMLSEFPKSIGVITANTYTQLANSTVEALKERLEMLGISCKAVLSGSKKRLEFAGTHAKLYSLEKYQTIRGITVDWWLGDESAFAKLDAVKVVRGRLRGKNGPRFERHMSSGNGFNWLYDQFEYKDGKKKQIAPT